MHYMIKEIISNKGKEEREAKKVTLTVTDVLTKKWFQLRLRLAKERFLVIIGSP